MSPTRNWRNHPAWAKTLSILAHCWAHCRRQFFDIAKPGPAPIAQEALQRIAKRYEIEAEIRGLSAADRRAARQWRTKPLLEAMKLWFEQRAAELPRKSSLAEAVGYALNQWNGLVRFLDDGRIEIDSNTAICSFGSAPAAILPSATTASAVRSPRTSDPPRSASSP